MERAIGIEPWSEAWEATNKNLKTLELGTLSRFAKSLIWKMKAMEGRALKHPFIFRADARNLVPILCLIT